MHVTTVIACCAALCASCVSPPPHTKESAEEQTPECLMMEEVCGQAGEFQKEFERMPEEERTDYTPALNTLVEHCENAKKTCTASRERR